MAQKTVERMLEKVSRLYEQGAEELRIEAYLKRWWQWVRSGVDGLLSAGVCFDWVLVGALHFWGFSARRLILAIAQCQEMRSPERIRGALLNLKNNIN